MMDHDTKAAYLAAVTTAARKVIKQPKEQTPTELFNPMKEKKEEKRVKSAKTAAKKSLKKKEIHKMTQYFPTK
jgi:hypothetical protein